MAATRYIAVDHVGNVTWALAASSDAPGAEDDARAWVDEAISQLQSAPNTLADPDLSNRHPVAIESSLTRRRLDYIADIEACKAELRAGESHEICLTNMVTTSTSEAPWATYRRLRRMNAAPYASFLRFSDLHILSLSQ